MKKKKIIIVSIIIVILLIVFVLLPMFNPERNQQFPVLDESVSVLVLV